jgi:23S rRNA pseudouridine1911/1915/1917 synthase
VSFSSIPRKPVPAGSLNQGWIYTDRAGSAAAGQKISAFYAARYRHSDQQVWQARLEAGEIHRNGQQLRADGSLAPGDRLAWHRPPWHEPPVPDQWQVVHDDGDILVIDKPSGLPVLPAGGFLEHTVLRLIERRQRDSAATAITGVPRPVHRLGRFTSGLLVLARQPATRAWLSALLRESTAAPESGCRKLYRALTQAGPLPIAVGERLEIHTPIGRWPHPLLGQVWAAASAADSAAAPLPAWSELHLLQVRPQAHLVEVAIRSGRPHQIRIHAASVGTPLLGDPLYLPGGQARPQALPGLGGYQLHAHRLVLPRPEGTWLELEAPLPPALELAPAAGG